MRALSDLPILMQCSVQEEMLVLGNRMPEHLALTLQPLPHEERDPGCPTHPASKLHCIAIAQHPGAQVRQRPEQICSLHMLTATGGAVGVVRDPVCMGVPKREGRLTALSSTVRLVTRSILQNRRQG